MLLCAWCGREPAIANVELIIGKTKMLVPLCGKHYVSAVMYERLGLQGFLRGLVQRTAGHAPFAPSLAQQRRQGREMALGEVDRESGAPGQGEPFGGS